MQGKIALEEHFAVPETALNPRGTYSDATWAELRGRLLELHDERLALMDRHGIEMMVVSLNAPAVQAIPDPKAAVALARKANDALAEEVARRPDRFQGLAALPMQDPEAAIVDWPFEEIAHAADWFDAVEIGENDRLKIGRSNAARLLELDVR
jgi:2,3-dihydroxybenzoate decarboxylase